MKKIILFLLLVPLFLMLFSKDVNAAEYSGYFDAESKQVESGDHFAIGLTLINNDQDISGIFLPIKYTDTDLTVDSVSFVGSFLNDNFVTGYYAFADSNLIQISVFPDFSTIGDTLPYLTAPNGLFATLYFTVSVSPTPGFAYIDSVNEESESGGKIHYFNGQLSSADGLSTYYPGFNEGVVEILAPTAVDENIRPGLPTEFALAQNYPNPFNPSTNIEFSLPTSGHVKLEVYNILGQLVETLVDETLTAGYHEVEYDASNQSSGIFFYRLTHQEGTETKKMVLVK